MAESKLADEFIPEIVKLDQLDEIIDVHDGDAILMAQKLCREFGLGVGISSGANLVAAIKVALARQDGLPIATVFADSNTRYLSTDLAGTEPSRSDYLSPRTRLAHLATISPATHPAEDARSV